MGRIANWGQLDTEGDKAFEAFKVYRDMGGKRSLRGAARELGKSKSLLDRWSQRHGWQRRVAAWDLEQDSLHRDARIKAIANATERHGKLAQVVLGLAAAELGMQQKGKCQTCGRSPVRLSPQALTRFLRVGVDIERTSLGLGSSSAPATTQINVTTTVVAGSQTTLILIRDEPTQLLASQLLARMKTLDPNQSLSRLADQQRGAVPQGTGHASKLEAVRLEATAREADEVGAAAAAHPSAPKDSVGGFEDDGTDDDAEDLF